MIQNKALWSLVAIVSATMILLSYLLQMYTLTSIEEENIFLFDADWLCAALAQPGGLARLLASFVSQMFICRFAGPLLVGVLYFIIVASFAGIIARRVRAAYVVAFAAVPCLCLMLCMENVSFDFQGVAAVVLCCVVLYAYSLIGSDLRLWLISVACVISGVMYWAVGTASIALALSLAVYDVSLRRGGVWLKVATVLYPLVSAAVAWLFYACGSVLTVAEAFTPVMYYDMGSTYFMMIYALAAIPICVIIIALTKHLPAPKKTFATIGIGCAILAVEVATTMNIYRMVHSVSNYENQQQRFYARHQMWAQIVAMPYDGAPTPYTSYRFLALAHQGALADNLHHYRPFISYIFENKPKVKKRDQQIYSDIWYDCDYMAAARHSAFDTNIVTPGRFNPYETLKLAEINIVYGDYAVADKLLSKLDKTLFYADDARRLRQYLYDDVLVESDPMLGPKRRAIPAENVYLSPKGIQRDLKYVIDCNPDQTVASEFYKAFLILTNQNENI